MTTPVQKSALDAIRLFRTKEIAGLYKHLRKFGPLPEPPASTTTSSTAENAISLPNPFLPKKHPHARKWLGAKYSLRRQAELVKKAQVSGTLDLLPPGPKKFAAELRAERVRAAMPLAQRELEEKMSKLAVSHVDAAAELKKEKAALEAKVAALRVSLAGMKESLVGVTAEYDAGQLASFEAESASDNISPADVAQRRAAHRQVSKTKRALEKRIKKTQEAVSSAKKRIGEIGLQAKVEENTAWKVPVLWAGTGAGKGRGGKTTPGAELGTRLYSGKKRMFKGHLWERKAAGRARRHAILMRDMPARIERYKSYYKKRKPNPLRPSRYTKPPKLPF
ncbi:hypothetical protein JR316_0008758 [Psilocybe cubensis]|uniref:Large ribosomal subunit protein mL59 domain-containing protein n=2 Tax=Psilocybe cubensis TaxID=181762 RepID=A0A8H7XUK9_PSICU|nr:hypothetical protein JR316_0008758 [Psilocybe cubensis]KAH9478305.1 hypothetical protein JR316_0008758 [Psilocybe cubensis]